MVSTLAVGAEFGLSYAQNREPFSGYQNPFALMLLPFQHPALLELGIPFSFTLLLILFAHEMGHYVACRIYGIDASYPYFIPAPTLFGTFGAFIRIRSAITTRRALFDVGLAGPVAGFVVALPALAYGVATSRIVPGAEEASAVVFGHPPLTRMLSALFHPNIDVTWLLLNPVGRAASIGLLVTALNLLPAWQLDGGHIMYSLTSARHGRISLIVSLGLIATGNCGMARMGDVGNYSADPVAAVSPSAGLRSVAAARSGAARVGVRRAGDFSAVLHSVARDDSVGLRLFVGAAIWSRNLEPKGS